MGTTIMFRLAAERPSYVENNISTFVCLGPVLVPTHSTAPIVHLVIPYQKSLYKLLTRFGYYELGEPTHFSKYIIPLICTQATFACKEVYKLSATNELGLSDNDTFEVFTGHYPSGGAT